MKLIKIVSIIALSLLFKVALISMEPAVASHEPSMMNCLGQSMNGALKIRKTFNPTIDITTTKNQEIFAKLLEHYSNLLIALQQDEMTSVIDAEKDRIFNLFLPLCLHYNKQSPKSSPSLRFLTAFACANQPESQVNLPQDIQEYIGKLETLMVKTKNIFKEATIVSHPSLALFYAAELGFTQIISDLVALGADVNASIAFGTNGNVITPLVFAKQRYKLFPATTRPPYCLCLQKEKNLTPEQNNGFIAELIQHGAH